MKRLVTTIAGACMAVALAVGAGDAAPVALSSSPLTLRSSTGQAAHIFPTVQLWKQLGMNNRSAARPPGLYGPSRLTYHGGPVMTGYINFYIIFWQPAKLQSGKATSMSAGYKRVVTDMVANYGGKGLSAMNTQYYQGTRRSGFTFITGQGGLAASVLDTDPFPKVRRGGCTVNYGGIGSDCYTGPQLEAEIQKVMAAQGWTGGSNKMFLVFTSFGEGSCFDNTSASCSYTQYCAYHSHVVGSSPDIIYGNEPYGNPATCQTSDAGTPNASLDPNADAAASPASHEISEAITDPHLDAWWDDASGKENGDECAYQYVNNYLDGGQANQLWAGRYFELQSEYDNATDLCQLAGPAGNPYYGPL